LHNPKILQTPHKIIVFRQMCNLIPRHTIIGSYENSSLRDQRGRGRRPPAIHATG